METLTYEKMRMAKSKSSSFRTWLIDFLSFAKNPETIADAFPGWEKVMKDPKEYLKYKSNAHEIIKYSSKKYIYFYNKDCSGPGELTNMGRAALDHSSIVEYFDMNFFNIEDPKIVLLSFVESLNQASTKLDLDVTEVMLRFYRIYFFTQDFEEERKYGPIKTRFVELYRKMTHNSVNSNPDGTLRISPAFYDKLTPSESKIVKESLSNGEKPTNSDYRTSMDVLRKYELIHRKDDSGVIWTRKTFNLTRSKDKKYVYLIDSSTGVVLKVFDIQIPISTINSMTESIIVR